MKTIRVLIVEESGRRRRALEAALASPELELVGSVGDVAAATRASQSLNPDIVVLNPAIAGGTGFSVIEEVMAFRPTPILVVTDRKGSALGFKAMALGALDVLLLPEQESAAAEFAVQLKGRVKLLAKVRVITHVKGRRGPRTPMPHERVTTPIVGIAASLGGPKALAHLLRDLPDGLPAPICIVQHISDGFAGGLATWLAAETGKRVMEAQDGQILVPGLVLVAPSGAHLTVGSDERVVLDHGPEVEGFRPSCNSLLHSLARRYGPRAIGVVMTGMGSDGAHGLLALRDAGGRTLAQDEATSVVYGMPKAALEAGGVERQVPLDELAEAIAGLVQQLATQGRPR